MNADLAPFDWKCPDYAAVIRERIERMARLRANPQTLPALKTYYSEHIAAFISDWAITVDPRVAAKGRSPFMPLVLFPRQLALVNWITDRWRGGEPGVVVKARDVGASWLAMAVAASLCLFHKNMAIGVGSATEVKLDRVGDPDTLFYKARQFLAHLPAEFQGGFDLQRHSPYLRVIIPETGSSITGEAGDQIGRGGRKAIFFIDESAHIERSQLVDAALATATDCRIDMSSVNGMANSFAEKAHNGKIPRFDFGWRDDPRKDDEWYSQKRGELDPVTLAQEIDCSFFASAEGLLIPSVWVQAAVGAHLKLGITPTGRKYAGLDVADEGKDANAFAARHGILLSYLKSWSGKGSDIYKSVVRAFDLCEELGIDVLDYDADGLGAGVRGDATAINDARKTSSKRQIRDRPFRGSGQVWKPESEMVEKRKNKDFFANAKAQAWWSLRTRFQATYRAVIEKVPYDPDRIISIAPGLDELVRLTMELSQISYHINTVGKVIVDKQPDGMRSPNLADATMIAYQPATRSLEIWEKLAS